MKKLISILCVFIIFLVVFISVAYARQGDDKPSDVAINNAIYWAESFVGRASFPVIGTTNGSCWSTYFCTDFVANAYGYPATPNHAALFWAVSVKQHAGDWNAPRGSLVFFGPTALNGERGHVALCTGNGNLIEAGYALIIESTIIDESHAAPYLGWAWPPSAWPGRSDIFKATALTWAAQTGKAVISTIVSWLIFLIIKVAITKIKQSQAEHGVMKEVNGV
jgi:cell wall-associated NlpC family hydrolase